MGFEDCILLNMMKASVSVIVNRGRCEALVNCPPLLPTNFSNPTNQRCFEQEFCINTFNPPASTRISYVSILPAMELLISTSGQAKFTFHSLYAIPLQKSGSTSSISIKNSEFYIAVILIPIGDGRAGNAEGGVGGEGEDEGRARI